MPSSRLLKRKGWRLAARWSPPTTGKHHLRRRQKSLFVFPGCRSWGIPGSGWPATSAAACQRADRSHGRRIGTLASFTTPKSILRYTIGEYSIRALRCQGSRGPPSQFLPVSDWQGVPASGAACRREPATILRRRGADSGSCRPCRRPFPPSAGCCKQLPQPTQSHPKKGR